MILLTDSSLWDHLEDVDLVWIIRAMHKKHGHCFRITEGIYGELVDVKEGAAVVDEMVAEGTICKIPPPKPIPDLNPDIAHLGNGEIELISAFSNLPENERKISKILTDDKQALGSMHRLEIPSSDITGFLIMCFRDGELSKTGALKVYDDLKSGGHYESNLPRDRFERELESASSGRQGPDEK